MPSTSSAAASEDSGGGSGPALSRNSGYHYQRREVERSTLYALVRDHLETFYQAVEEGFASAPLPNFVKLEFERFLDCGVLCRGAALLVCETCSQTNVIALSCKGRGYAEWRNMPREPMWSVCGGVLVASARCDDLAYSFGEAARRVAHRVG